MSFVALIILRKENITKFRISSHDLQIETGINNKPWKTPVEERKNAPMVDTTNHRKHLLRKEIAPIVICKK